MNKEFVEIINRLRAILQDSWINELPDNEKIAINFNKSELKLILNCISKERPAPVRIDRGLFGYDIVCSHCSSMLKKLPIYDKKDFLAVLEDSSYYLGKHCRYCGQALDLSPVEERKHGHWEDIDLDTSVCSVCKKPQEYETKYCPECGAKMENNGDDDDE